MVGPTNRSIQDGKLIETIFQTHHNLDSRVSAGPVYVYGATATNLIINARLTTNAMANTAKDAGTENIDQYKETKKAYLGIDYIHTMRESLNKAIEAVRTTEIPQASGMTTTDGGEDEQRLTPPVLDRQALRRSGWLRHVIAVLENTLLIVRNMHINSLHVLINIHFSDGSDRTAQLSSLALVCLHPFYQAQRRFAVLVEKDLLAFGHKFLDRRTLSPNVRAARYLPMYAPLALLRPAPVFRLVRTPATYFLPEECAHYGAKFYPIRLPRSPWRRTRLTKDLDGLSVAGNRSDSGRGEGLKSRDEINVRGGRGQSTLFDTPSRVSSRLHVLVGEHHQPIDVHGQPVGFCLGLGNQFAASRPSRRTAYRLPTLT